MKAAVLTLLLLTPSAALAADSASPEQSATDLIAKRCLACHNSQSKTSGLDLSTRNAAERGGERGPALAAGDAQSSLIYLRIAAGEMPLGNPLPENEREVIRQWIEAGAPWTGSIGEPREDRPRAGLDWWSLQPLKSHTPPVSETIPPQWSQSPIDRWVHARLEREGLAPAPPAKRHARDSVGRLSICWVCPLHRRRSTSSSKTPPKTRTKSSSIACCLRPVTANAGRGTGSTSPDSRKAKASSATGCARTPGPIATTLSAA